LSGSGAFNESRKKDKIMHRREKRELGKENRTEKEGEVQGGKVRSIYYNPP